MPKAIDISLRHIIMSPAGLPYFIGSQVFEAVTLSAPQMTRPPNGGLLGGRPFEGRWEGVIGHGERQ